MIGAYGHCIISNSKLIFLNSKSLYFAGFSNSELEIDSQFVHGVTSYNSTIYLTFKPYNITYQLNLSYLPSISLNSSKLYLSGLLKINYTDSYNTLPINYRSGEVTIFYVSYDSEIQFIDFTYETNFLTLARFHYSQNQYPKIIFDRLTLSASHIYEQNEECYVFSGHLSDQVIPVFSRNIDLVYTSKYIEAENRYRNIFNKVKFSCTLSNTNPSLPPTSVWSFHTKIGTRVYSSSASTIEDRIIDIADQINLESNVHGVQATPSGNTLILNAINFDGSYMYLYHSNDSTVLTVLKHNYPGISISPLNNHIKYTP